MKFKWRKNRNDLLKHPLRYLASWMEKCDWRHCLLRPFNVSDKSTALLKSVFFSFFFLFFFSVISLETIRSLFKIKINKFHSSANRENVVACIIDKEFRKLYLKTNVFCHQYARLHAQHVIFAINRFQRLGPIKKSLMLVQQKTSRKACILRAPSTS